MNGLEFLLILLVWWLAGGYYARRQAIARNLMEQPSLASALLQGPFWVRRMLIWSTIGSGQEAKDDSHEEPADRTRGSSPVSSPAAMLNPIAAASGEANRFTNTAAQPAAPVTPPVTPQPIRPAEAPTTAPQPVAPPAVTPDPKPAPAPQPAQPIAPNVAPAVLSPSADTIPSGVTPPKRLPGKPMFGKVKTLCPWCNSKQSFDKQAICDQCGKPNPWLEVKWKLTPASANMQPGPAAAAPAPVQPAPPQDNPTPAPVPVIQEDLQVTPQVVPAPGSVDSPAAPAPQAASQPAPVPVPEVAPQPVTPPAPQAAPPQAVPTVTPQTEEAQELPPAGVAKPKKLPSKPVLGQVKTTCPWCGEKRKFGKDAVCSDCSRVNPWLVEKWGIASQETSVTAATPVDFSALEKVRIKAEVQDDTLVELDPDQEIEAFDSLPDRPKRGKVSTVCPSCHQRSDHDREGTCKQCGQPNDWLRKRWGLVEMSAQVSAAPVGPAPSAPEAAPVNDPNICPSCKRAKAADLEGNCIFCGTELEVS